MLHTKKARKYDEWKCKQTVFHEYKFEDYKVQWGDQFYTLKPTFVDPV